MDKSALETYARLAQLRDIFFDVVQGVVVSVVFILFLALIHTIDLNWGV